MFSPDVLPPGILLLLDPLSNRWCEDVNDWDARKYPRCKPYYGKKGVQWNNFVRDFSISLLDETDADASLKETMLGTDPGGDVSI